MENFEEKYFGHKILVVNAININNVKYVHKINKKSFKFNSIVICLSILLFINLFNIIKVVLEIE